MQASRARRCRSSLLSLLLAGAVATGCDGSGGTAITTNASGGSIGGSRSSQTSGGDSSQASGGVGGEGAGGATSSSSSGGATSSSSSGGAATGGATSNYPPAMLDPDYTYFGAGSRLTPLVRSIGEGVGVLTGTWIDSELSTPCFFQPTPDGESRCIPYTLGEANLHYAAADCSAAFATISPPHFCSNTVAEPTGEFFTSLSACRYEVYRITGPVTEAVAFDGPETSCSVTDPTQASARTQIFGVEYMPPERFVARRSVVEEEDRAPGLRVVRLEGDDGSWTVTGFRDSVRDAPCSPLGEAFAEPGRCAPTPRITADEYVDAECSEPGVFRRSGEMDECGEVPEVVPRALARSVPSEEECGPPSLELYEVLDPVLTDRYERVGASCNLVGDEPLEMYPAGLQIDAATFPLLEQVSLGSGHLSFRFFTIDGVPLAPSGSLIDMETGEGCRDELFTDGVVRCVPPRTWVMSNVTFADATCSEQPIITDADRVTNPCFEHIPPKGILLRVEDGTCTRPARAGWLEPFTGDTYYQRTADACEPRATADLSEDLVLLQMGEEVDPDEVFGRVEVVQAR